jgi:hypothetical protein
MVRHPLCKLLELLCKGATPRAMLVELFVE